MLLALGLVSEEFTGARYWVHFTHAQAIPPSLFKVDLYLDRVADVAVSNNFTKKRSRTATNIGFCVLVYGDMRPRLSVAAFQAVSFGGNVLVVGGGRATIKGLTKSFRAHCLCRCQPLP